MDQTLKKKKRLETVKFLKVNIGEKLYDRDLAKFS